VACCTPEAHSSHIAVSNYLISGRVTPAAHLLKLVGTVLRCQWTVAERRGAVQQQRVHRRRQQLYVVGTGRQALLVPHGGHGDDAHRLGRPEPPALLVVGVRTASLCFLLSSLPRAARTLT
jgi:hypothetical protein